MCIWANHRAGFISGLVAGTRKGLGRLPKGCAQLHLGYWLLQWGFQDRARLTEQHGISNQFIFYALICNIFLVCLYFTLIGWQRSTFLRAEVMRWRGNTLDLMSESVKSHIQVLFGKPYVLSIRHFLKLLDFSFIGAILQLCTLQELIGIQIRSCLVWVYWLPFPSPRWEEVGGNSFASIYNSPQLSLHSTQICASWLLFELAVNIFLVPSLNELNKIFNVCSFYVCMKVTILFYFYF